MTSAPACGVERFALLASAIAGRTISVKQAPEAQLRAFSDGLSVSIPADDDAVLSAALQAALVGAGSLDPAIMQQLAGRGRLSERYLYCECLRAASFCGDRLPLWITRKPELSEPLTGTALESLAHARGASAMPRPPIWFGTIKPARVLRTALSEHGLVALIRGPQEDRISIENVGELDEYDAGEESKILKLFQSPIPFQNPLSSLLNNILGAGLAKGATPPNGEKDGGGELAVGRIEQVMRRGINAILSRWPQQPPAPDLPLSETVMKYPEWDVHNRRYRADWVSVSEVDAWRPDGPQDMSDILVRPPLELQRQLGSLGLDHEMHRRQQDGADLDTEALIDCAIELQSGHSPHTINIYRSSRRTRRDLAVVIIVDISGSTGDVDAAGRFVFGRHLQVAYRLGHTLDKLGDTVAMFGFHSWGRSRAHVVRIKGHGERWSSEIGQRLRQLEPVGYTRIGAAIRYGTDLLQSQIRLPNRLLILITDGIAYDQGYERSYAEGDARKALEEANSKSTACVCISVGSSTEVAKLISVFGVANVLAVDDVEQITGRISTICRSALNQVSHRFDKRFAAAARRKSA